jgi:hypothetical protein
MRVEVLGGVERRRRWSSDEKMRLVEETLVPGAKVSEVARRNGISASLLFTWRRQSRAMEAPAVPRFAAVQIAGPVAVAAIERPPSDEPPLPLVSKFLLHQPLNRQSETYAREGIELDVSTLADRVGACVVALDPIIRALWAHVLSAERIHADDTTVPVLAKMKTVTGRIQPIEPPWPPFSWSLRFASRTAWYSGVSGACCPLPQDLLWS